jgi:N-acetylneuraminic acid mutarotase
MRTVLTLPMLLTFIVPPSATDPELPPMPKGVSSFGAITCDGYLYVYGGHIGEKHTYSNKDVQGSFHRLKLDGGTKWEELPGGPSAQGLNLAAHGGKVYRIGGMQPRNDPGEPEDIHSLADCARFYPKTKKWEDLPSLPAGRSSIDVVVAGDKLVVVGGWHQRGKGEKFVWYDTVVVLDLAAAKPEWKSIPQPFKRRALTASAVGNKVYVIGGLTPEGTDPRVDVLDVTTGKWSTGPALPGKERAAFSPAATVVNGRIVVNTSDGPVFRLNEAGDGWEKVGEAATKRMVARLVPFNNDSVLLLGGVGGNANVATVEVVKLAAKGERVTGDR